MLIEELLSNGADVDAIDRDGHTPLQLAARLATVDVAELLIKNGADVNAIDRNGHTPLYYAKKDSPMEKLLIDNGAIKQ